MKRNELTGLAFLFAFLVISGLMCAFATGGGQAFGSTFASSVANTDYPPNAALDVQLEPFQQALGAYWLIDGTAVFSGVITLFWIVLQVVTRRHIPRSWCLFLLALGVVTGSVLLVATQMQSQMSAIPIPAPPSGSSTYEGLTLGFGIFKQLFGFVAGLFGFIGAILFVWTLIRQPQS